VTNSNKAKVGLIGAGWWATTNHLPVLEKRDDIELISVCRKGKTELAQVAERFGFQHATEDYRELLDRNDLDGVIVASPHTLHYEHALAAIQNGLHVMCEKPLATRSDLARHLISEASKFGVEVLIPYGWHYCEFIQKAKQLLETNAVGNVEYVMCHMASPIRSLLEGKPFLSTGGGAGELMFEPHPDTWAHPDVAGGGYGLSQMSHSAGLAFWLTGLKPNEVFAYVSSPTSKVELYDSISTKFEGGAIGIFSGAGALPENQKFQLDVRIFGSEGVLTVDCDRARLELLRHDEQNYSEKLDVNAGEYFGGGPTENFADLLTGKSKVNYAPGWCGMRSIELIDAAYKSAKANKPIKI
jgi:predicted dehydrogenase